LAIFLNLSGSYAFSKSGSITQKFLGKSCSRMSRLTSF